MSRPACSLVMLFLAAMAGCDPLYTTQYRQSLAPAAAPTCVEAALGSSPLAAVVWRDTADVDRGTAASFVVTVRDPLTPGGRWTARVAQGGVGDSAWVRVSHSYMGYETPRTIDQARWAAQARELLEEVRSRCAPATPPDIECKSIGGLGGQGGAC